MYHFKSKLGFKARQKTLETKWTRNNIVQLSEFLNDIFTGRYLSCRHHILIYAVCQEEEVGHVLVEDAFKQSVHVHFLMEPKTQTSNEFIFNLLYTRAIFLGSVGK